jgi:hypothetical protein
MAGETSRNLWGVLKFKRIQMPAAQKSRRRPDEKNSPAARPDEKNENRLKILR